MKIALIGYGKMGKAIETIAVERGHSISARISQANQHELDSALENADCAIEFTKPDSAVANIQKAIASGTPIVVGTTGWNDSLNLVSEVVNNKNGSLLHASNFSVGVNLFFAVNEKLAQLMSTQPSYKATLEEIHHIHKLDEPSGTAISLANQVSTNHPHYSTWHLGTEDQAHSLPIEAKRINETPGTHSVSYSSSIDTISIKHEAHNRTGFATGAVLAAEWLVGKHGIFTMKDVLGI
jgi:4-hydroxy-tetrahydrodipicolinate reductase